MTKLSQTIHIYYNLGSDISRNQIIKGIIYLGNNNCYTFDFLYVDHTNF